MRTGPDRRRPDPDQATVVRVEPLTTARNVRGPFDYRNPGGLDVGAMLDVPFGRQRLTAIVTGLAGESEHELADPHRVLPFSLPAELVELGLWMAREYCSTPARSLSLMLPPGGVGERRLLWAEAGRAPDEGERLTYRQRSLLDGLPRFAGTDLAALRRLEARGLVTISARTRRREPRRTGMGASATPPRLNSDQAAALSAIVGAGAGSRLLLAGVTGSGKTEVYLHAAGEVLDAGRSVIVLVPEIGLTPQMVDRFVARFGDMVAVLHSGLGEGERLDEWLRLRRGEARIAVGPRSAVFAPLTDVGLVIVDEEHDSSYKNEGDPRYDARLLAARRAAGGVLVCGSATPRPETVVENRRLSLPRRADGSPMPPVEVVDLRQADGYLHPRTHDAIAMARKSIVLLNRRGWSNFLTCRSCGRAWECPQCDVALVLHRAQGIVACHHCGHREPLPTVCPDCGSVSIARHGAGIERAAADLARIGPVMSLDGSVSDPGRVLAAFQAADRAILIGTQVVAKGHDFPDVDLGVVLDADSTLRFPDFRAEERTFALVTQLAGRAGRAGDGRVIVQTSDPAAPAILHAAGHDADGFLAGELERRRALRYPPFSSLIRIVCSGAPGDPAEAATGAANEIRGAIGDLGVAGDVLGPAPLFRLRNRERAQVVVKALERRSAIDQVDAAVRATAARRIHRSVAFSVDVDPQ